MTNNDILRRLRYAFDFSDKNAIELFTTDPASTAKVSVDEFRCLLAQEEDENYRSCGDVELAAFLDGLIVAKRGLREPALLVVPTAAEKPDDFRLSKNDILKKLRIAMNFRTPEMLATIETGGSVLSKAELGALFRNPQHKHYRPCGNQVLRNFIKGLTAQLRKQ